MDYFMICWIAMELSSRSCTVCPPECKTKMKCQWVINHDLPEHFKPEISGVLALRRGQNYIVLTNVGPNPNQEVIDWYLEDAASKGYNLAYRRNDKDSFFGDPDFIAKMYGSLGSA
jgi:hypothetical protein